SDIAENDPKRRQRKNGQPALRRLPCHNVGCRWQIFAQGNIQGETDSTIGKAFAIVGLCCPRRLFAAFIQTIASDCDSQTTDEAFSACDRKCPQAALSFDDSRETSKPALREYTCCSLLPGLDAATTTPHT